MINPGKMGKCKAESDFDKGQIDNKTTGSEYLQNGSSFGVSLECIA